MGVIVYGTNCAENKDNDERKNVQRGVVFRSRTLGSALWLWPVVRRLSRGTILAAPKLRLQNLERNERPRGCMAVSVYKPLFGGEATYKARGSRLQQSCYQFKETFVKCSAICSITPANNQYDLRELCFCTVYWTEFADFMSRIRNKVQS